MLGLAMLQERFRGHPWIDERRVPQEVTNCEDTHLVQLMNDMQQLSSNFCKKRNEIYQKSCTLIL